MRKLIEGIEMSLMYHPRYKHSKRLEQMALHLNKIHHLGIEEDAIKLSALLHDVSKNLSDEENLKIMKDNMGDNIDEDLLKCPSIWHAFSGKYIAQNNYHIINEDILNAICYHTTGRPQMSNLEKVIFLSDYIEVGRVGLCFEAVREIAEKDINEAIVKMYEQQFEYIISSGNFLYPLSRQAYDYYKKENMND